MGKALGIDYGTKRTGIAITDAMQIIASGLTTVATHTLTNFIADIEPEGRELQFSANYGKNINRRVKFESDLSYVMDEGNTSGNDNAIIMFYIKWDS